MVKQSAGLLMFRRREAAVEVLLVHPGGPLWRDKDVWGIPKGEYEPGEDPLQAACREFVEETGFVAAGPYLDLGEITQRSGKRVRAWAFEGDCDAGALVSNSFSMEWPPHSGRVCEFPEVDRAEWMALDAARRRIVPAQAPLLDELEKTTFPKAGSFREGGD
jgi:predicted NUDIX family NTP pyrophosphohydrolase